MYSASLPHVVSSKSAVQVSSGEMYHQDTSPPLPDGGAQYPKSQRGLQKQTNKKHQKAMPRPCLVQSNEDDVSASPALLNPNLGARHAARFFHLLFHFVFRAARGGCC